MWEGAKQLIQHLAPLGATKRRAADGLIAGHRNVHSVNAKGHP